MKCAVVECTNEAVWSGKGRQSKYCSDACKQMAYRNKKTAIRNKRLREQRSRLFLVPLSLDQANLFVSLYHRHSKPVLRAKFYLGAIDEAGLLRGVVIVGRPVARLLDDGRTLEVNRVCTDGVPGGCSALYGAARRVAFEMGYQRLVTYTLLEESGASMRGAGWRRVKEIKGHAQGWQNRDGRKKQEVCYLNKWRWETINPAFARGPRPKVIVFPLAMQEAVQTSCEQMSFEELG